MECRLCLSRSPFMCIFRIECKFLDSLLCLLKINNDDGLPDMICKDCLKELTHMDEFLSKCQESDNILRNRTIQGIKLEPKDQNFSFDKSLVSNVKKRKRKKGHKYSQTSNSVSLYEFIDVKAGISDEERCDADKIEKPTLFSENDTKLMHSTVDRSRNHHEEKQCDKYFKDGRLKKKFNKMVKTCDYTKPRTCVMCGESFLNRGLYHYHLQKHSNIDFICDYCGHSFKHRSTLANHIKCHMQTDMFTCHLCYKLFKYQRNLLIHLKKNHSNNKIHKSQSLVAGKTERDYTCVICGKEYKSNELLKEHILQHINSEKNNCIQCNICSKIFTSNEDLTTHLTYHSDAKPFICRYCPKAFKNEDLRTTHEVTHTAGTPFKCPICQKGFALKCNMKCHIRNSHKGMKIDETPPHHINNKKPQEEEIVEVKQEIDVNVNEYPFVDHSDHKPINDLFDNDQEDSFFNDNDTNFEYDEKCLKEPVINMKNYWTNEMRSNNNPNADTGIKRKYVKKMKEKNNSKIEGYLCSICGMYIEKKNLYHQHFRRHINTTQIFECDPCGKVFKKKASLKEHIEVNHMEIKMVPCKICQKPFKHLDYARKHERLVHGEHKVHTCVVCGKEFKNKKYLELHTRTHTGRPRNVQCDICSKFFTDKYSMTRHTNIYHSDARPYTCRFCPKAFKTFNHRGRHEMLHTGEVPHKCPVCFKAYNQKSNMKSHFVHNHKELDYNEIMAQFHKQQKAAQQNQTVT